MDRLSFTVVRSILFLSREPLHIDPDLLGLDRGDLDSQIILPMAFAADVVLTAFELDHRNTLRSPLGQHVGGDLGSLDQRVANLGFLVFVSDQQDAVEGYGRSITR